MCSGQNKYSFTRFGQENKAEANCKHLVSAFRQCPFWVSFSFSPLTHNFFSYVPLLLCRFLLIFYFLFFKSFIAMFFFLCFIGSASLMQYCYLLGLSYTSATIGSAFWGTMPATTFIMALIFRYTYY